MEMWAIDERGDAATSPVPVLFFIYLIYIN